MLHNICAEMNWCGWKEIMQSFSDSNKSIYFVAKSKPTNPLTKSNKIVLNRDKFREVFDQYFASLVGFANTFVSDINLSEDLVQEVFVSLWEKQDEYQNEITLKVYLYRAVRNKCLNNIKHEQVKNKYIAESLPKLETEEFFLDQVLSEEVSRLLYKFIGELPKQRQQIIRYSLLGLKNQEIADIMGLTINTVKSHKLNAYRELREKLGKHAYLVAILLEINL
ncbi:RNA polymerase sigma-70 factor [Marinifilum sp. D714]|uniref:RNA polymerase sigma-70 factor n=1 Tax=Marinifilum sp. D714 TaxID=2937523 RepID=UPI0027C0ECEA|nr:RNA polymerase sigma-70 factor [Marinifilum sp. D714]MDQ2177185.1 RNA polymerase sigma-70 factor [Marinifilum sp. D714]